MSYSYNVASAEFATLCQSQIKLLTQGLGAISSAIYLTGEVEQSPEKQLLLFAIYPQTKSKFTPQIAEVELPEILQRVIAHRKIAPSSLLTDEIETDNLSAVVLEQENLATKQLVLPLIHEEVMMGLLITGREDRHWKQQELEQVKAIAVTLAIARFLEKQSQWYREQLKLQQSMRHWEQEQLGNLLHQLRNPLTALRTFSKLLLKRLLPQDRNQSIVESILRESDRLSELIDRFAAETSSDAPEKLPVTLSTTSVRLLAKEEQPPHNFLLPGNIENLDNLDLKKVLEPLLISTRTIAESKTISFVTNIPSNLPPVKGNSGALREVFNNLLDNSIKYTPEKGQITVRIEQKDNALEIAIEDTGYGIPETDLEHLFERSYRGVQAEGNIPGTGLGLAIAKQLIEQMQGNIEVISPNNRSNNTDFPGTIFIVWLSTVIK
ncbi:Signal transduction histidine kinase [Hyella patelloides LEGE 07179]|uniref:histidine kinase n=1 Tax=Hyella patelloides LEGE 07179 TaxID=945734 RepID=A0A563VSA9_9CYAN|nr:ATP-binding protein [Hyella patelloides]VEP14338.1 Signal transduction histidine kinase [Hyella patelloides LEGE 07179]